MRLPALTRDLSHLAGPPVRPGARCPPAAAAYADRIRLAARAEHEMLLAHHYVRYLGDLSGGQLIGRALRRIYHLPDERGTEGYRFDAIASAKPFKDHYRALLDALPWDDDARTRLVDEAGASRIGSTPTSSPRCRRPHRIADLVAGTRSGEDGGGRPPALVEVASAGDEVLGLGVVADDGRGRLLGLVLEAGLLADLDADAVGAEQLGHLRVVLEVGARGVAPRVAAAAVLLAEQPGEVGPSSSAKPHSSRMRRCQ